jgi:hypothetical protein
MRRRDPRPVRRIERIPRRDPPSREQAGSFSHFTLQEEKRVRVVLKPVPREIPVEEIAEDLEAQGFHPIGVHRMRRLISKKELPLVELPPSEKNIFELKTVCFLTVNVEKPRRNGWVSQCHNCQWFHHSQRNCRAAPRCVKCGNNHSSNTSEKSKETPAIAQIAEEVIQPATVAAVNFLNRRTRQRNRVNNKNRNRHRKTKNQNRPLKLLLR